MTTITCLIVWMPPAIWGRDGMGVAATVVRGTAFTKTAAAITAHAAPHDRATQPGGHHRTGCAVGGDPVQAGTETPSRWRGPVIRGSAPPS
ncbi:MAG TPA: hypothetical protein VHN56_04990 [Actinomycetota bacterium]|nr:hypothetical protein [Actinomycetota bacterium]